MKVARCDSIMAFLIGGGLVACSADARPNATTTQRDSAGVAIYEVHPATWPPPSVWSLGEHPEHQIGVRTGDPDQELANVRGAVGRSDGGTVAAEFDARLRYYDAQGRHVLTLERMGSGPGEASAFLQIASYRADSLLLKVDESSGMSRLLVLGSDGSFGRDVILSHPSDGTSSDSVVYFGMPGDGVQTSLGDGSFIVRGMSRVRLSGVPGTPLSATAPLMRFDPAGNLVDSIAQVVTQSVERQPSDPRGYRNILTASSPISIRARGTTLFQAFPEEFRVDVYEAQPLSVAFGADDTSARLRSSFRLSAPLTPATSSSRMAHIDLRVTVFRHNASEQRREEYRQMLTSLSHGPTWSAVQDLAIDAAGNLWLEMPQSLDAQGRSFARQFGIDVEPSPSQWIILSPEGRPISTLELPLGFELLEAGTDYVLGLWHDEYGVQYLHRYRLLKN